MDRSRAAFTCRCHRRLAHVVPAPDRLGRCDRPRLRGASAYAGHCGDDQTDTGRSRFPAGASTRCREPGGCRTFRRGVPAKPDLRTATLTVKLKRYSSGIVSCAPSSATNTAISSAGSVLLALADTRWVVPGGSKNDCPTPKVSTGPPPSCERISPLVI